MASAPPTILFLHGFTHTGRSWDGVRAALPRGYRALTPDIRGHGSAGACLPVTLEAVLDDLAELAPAEPFTLCGYSMGGRIALHAALDPRIGPLVRRLVLIGASPGLQNPREREARREADERLAAEVEGMTIEVFAERWAQTPVLAGLPADVAAAVHRDRLRSTPAGLAAALRALGTGALPSLWERLGELAMPVEVVVGERDDKFTGIAGEMAGRMPDPGVYVVPGVGHAVHLEAPEAVGERL